MNDISMIVLSCVQKNIQRTLTNSIKDLVKNIFKIFRALGESKTSVLLKFPFIQKPISVCFDVYF